MRDITHNIVQMTASDIETLAVLLDAPDLAAAWSDFESRTEAGKALFGEALATELAKLVPKIYRTKRSAPVLYGQLLEYAADSLEIDTSLQSAPSIDVLGRKVAEEVARSMLKAATPEQRDAFVQRLRGETEKLRAKVHDASASTAAVGMLTAAKLTGLSTYVLASSLTAVWANALGISLPYATYTALFPMIATILGPTGWAVAGIAGVIGLRATRSRIEARQRLRFLAVVTYLVAVDERVRENIPVDAAEPGSDAAIAQLKKDIEESWSLLEEFETTIGTKNSELEMLEARNGVLQGQVAELEKQLRIARTRKGLTHATEAERVVPIATDGNHKGIWKGPVNSIDDVPQPDRAVFKKLMEHTGVLRIHLGKYAGANPRPRRPPVLLLRQSNDGRLIGKLYTKAARSNYCDIVVVVEKGRESSVIDYATEEGLMRSS